MPTVTLSKQVVEQLIGKKLSMAQLKDRIAMLGTDLEKIEGNEIHVEIFPNRPDLLSEQGLARALASFIGVKTGLRKYAVKKSGYRVLVDKSVSMRPYTVCALVKNLRFDDERIREIMQLQEKLSLTHGRNRLKSAYGFYPAEHIAFPVKYVALDPQKVTFAPLGFSEPMRAIEVEERHPTGHKFKHIAAGWQKYPFFIDADGKVLCMLPYTNAEEFGRITEQTSTVFIECTGTDLANVRVALHILASTLADMGGQVYSIEMVYPDRKFHTPDFSPREMKLDLPYLNKRLGLSLKEREAVRLLARMGYGYAKGKVLIPAYRADILHQVDLGEDLAIAYGYENFAEIIPNVATVGKQDPIEVRKGKIADILVGMGVLESNTYHLIDRMAQTGVMLRSTTPVEILDPVSLEYNTLRETMLASLLEVLRTNRGREYPQRLFDMGTVFTRDAKSESGIAERQELGVVFAHHAANYTEALQHLDYLLRMLGVTYVVQTADAPPFIPGRSAEVLIRGKRAGVIGEFHPQVLSTLGLETPVVGFGLDLDSAGESNR